MKEDKAKMLCEALRSNKFEQIRQALRSNKGFCCLGVATQLYLDAHPEEKWKETAHGSFYFDNSSAFLSQKVMDWFGFKERTGQYNGKQLTGHNDGNFDRDSQEDYGPNTFLEIAQIIEDNIDAL